MTSKFEQVPSDEDTRIIFQQETKFADYDVLYQMWNWDGITGESIIFASEDVSELRDDELEGELKRSPVLKESSSITVQRTESGFTFVNFNFET